VVGKATRNAHMDVIKRLCLGLAVTALLCVVGGAALSAQEGEEPETPPTEETELPPMPEAPVAQEDAEAIETNLEASRAARQAAAAELAEARAAAGEDGLSEEEQEARNERVESLVARVASLDDEIRERRTLLQAAQEGPTRAQLEARREFDRMTERINRVAAELITDPRQEDGQLEGVLGRRIRESIEELGRLEALSRQFDPATVNFEASRVYQRLSEIERLEYEMRWADQSFNIAIREYEHLRTEVFEAFRAYEQRAIEGLRAARRAREELWPVIRGTPAATLEIPNLPMSLDELQEQRDTITRRLGRRNGTLEGEHRYRITELEGLMRQIQERIDIREEFKTTLAREAERVKDLIAEGAQVAEAATEAAPRAELADYQRLSIDIAALEEELKQLNYQLTRLESEREALQGVVTERMSNERNVETLVNDFDQQLQELEARWEALAARRGEMRADVWRYEMSLMPRILLFSIEEELEARRERLSAARRETRAAETELDIEERRIERIQERIQEINEVLLPDLRREYYEAIAKTVGIRAIKVAAVFLVAWLILWLMKVVGSPLIERIVRRSDGKSEFSADEQQRARTLMTVFMTTARVLVYITAIMFAIAQFDVDYGPLLVAAGGISLAVGFGAQTLVRDFFAGFFILLEGQFSIGDVVELNGMIGTVENLNLRTTVLRSLDGSVHTIPNGEVSRTTNMTKQWSRAIVDVGVAYEENTDDICGIMEAVAQEMREDANWGHKLLEYIMFGVHELGDSGVEIRILLKTRAGEQWGVAREYRRRVKLKFDELGVEIPWPQRVISYKSYADQDEETRRNAGRAKKARILRYVRRARGEITEEEAALANMSVEERDRAMTLARHQADKAISKAETRGKDPVDVARQRKQEAHEDENLTDAERLARQLAKQKVKDQTVVLSPEDAAAAEAKALAAAHEERKQEEADENAKKEAEGEKKDENEDKKDDGTKKPD
jgi:moderate conductance mechanosensitive channel